MRFFFAPALWLAFFSQSSAQLEPTTWTPPCTRLNLWEYKVGMRFFFPVSAALLEKNPVYPEFSQLESCVSNKVNSVQVSYSQLAGKTFEIVDVKIPRENKVYFGGNHWLYEFTLQNTKRNQCFSYTVVLDRRRFSCLINAQTVDDGFFIRGAINLDELEATARLLTGKKFFTLFPLHGKRDEPVRITKVEAGTWETPLRIHYQSKEVADTAVNVNLCGTNVPGTYLQPFQFTSLFSPQSSQGVISDNLWAVIRNGKPRIGMPLHEVQLTLGKPQQVKQTLTDKGVFVEYTYAKYHLFFEDGKLTKIESSS